MEKLDSLSKIMLATGAINYMAVSIDSVNEQIKMTKLAYKGKEKEFDDIHGEGIQSRNEVLAETVKELGAIMEKLGNLINNQDALCPLDQYVTTPAFNVIVQGKDDVNYDGEDDND